MLKRKLSDDDKENQACDPANKKARSPNEESMRPPFDTSFKLNNTLENNDVAIDQIGYNSNVEPQKNMAISKKQVYETDGCVLIELNTQQFTNYQNVKDSNNNSIQIDILQSPNELREITNHTHNSTVNMSMEVNTSTFENASAHLQYEYISDGLKEVFGQVDNAFNENISNEQTENRVQTGEECSLFHQELCLLEQNGLNQEQISLNHETTGIEHDQTEQFQESTFLESETILIDNIDENKAEPKIASVLECESNDSITDIVRQVVENIVETLSALEVENHHMPNIYQDNYNSEDEFVGNTFEERLCLPFKRKHIQPPTMEPSVEEKLNLVNQCLKKVDTERVFAIEGDAIQLPQNIEIEISEIGTLSFPLSKEQIGVLIEKSETTTFGKNKTIQHSYQFPASRINIKNPDWDQRLDDLLDKICQRMSFLGRIEARLEKMVLQNTGCKFEKNRLIDANVNGRFGTLLIELPSTYTGGQIIIHENHIKNTYVIDLSNESSNTSDEEKLIRFAAYYSDLRNEMLEIQSGCRLFLVYSIFTHQNFEGIIDNSSVEICLFKLFSHMHNWSKSPNLAIRCDFNYSYAKKSKRTGVKPLKGIDKSRFDILKTVNQILPQDKKLNFYLCHAKLRKQWLVTQNDSQEKKYEENDYLVTMENIYSLETSESVLNCFDYFDFNINSFFTGVLNPNSSTTPFGMDVDSENWGDVIEEITEKSDTSETLTKILSQFFLVFWPKKREFENVININFKSAIDLLESVDFARYPDYVLEIIEKLFSRMETIQAIKKYNILEKGEYVVKVLNMLLQIKRIEPVVKFFSNILHELRAFDCDLVAKLIEMFGLDALKQSLNKFIVPNAKNLHLNCIISKCLIEHNRKEIALVFFTDYILPVMKNESEFNNFIINHKEYVTESYGNNSRLNDNMIELYKSGIRSLDNKYSVPYKLGELIACLNHHEAADIFQGLIVKFLSQTQLETLLMNFLNEPALVRSLFTFKPISALFASLKQLLEQKAATTKPVFSWAMPNAKLSEHPNIEEFLKGDQPILIIENSFLNIYDARKFAKRFHGFKNGYSIDITPRGSGAKSTAEIHKTTKIYEKQMEEFNLVENNIRKIDELLKQTQV